MIFTIQLFENRFSKYLCERYLFEIEKENYLKVILFFKYERESFSFLQKKMLLFYKNKLLQISERNSKVIKNDFIKIVT